MSHPNESVMAHDMGYFPTDCTAICLGQKVYDIPQFHRILIGYYTSIETLGTVFSTIIDQELVIHLLMQILVARL